MIKKILLSIPILMLLLIGARLWMVSNKRETEMNFHEAIPKTISLVSNDFAPNGTIPLECSGKGQNTVPSFFWSNLPEGTKSLAFLVTDYDGPAPFLKLTIVSHWVVYNIPTSMKGIEKGSSTAALQAKGISLGENFTKGIDYAGPKPPLGVHRYYFRVYALSVPALELTNPKKQEVLEAMKGKVLAYGELMGRF